MLKQIFIGLALVLLLLSLGSCYRMPDDEELYTVPATNHPDLTRQPAQEWQPNVTY